MIHERNAKIIQSQIASIRPRLKRSKLSSVITDHT